MSNQNNTTTEVSEELRLLRKIDHKVDGIDSQLAGMKKQAILYGAVAGGLSGAIVAGGIMAAKIKLGL
ncbi:hypothetical protein [Undibacterium sp. Ren11W]|uniref:hypothetical protein n=1 Tax=Undibacterium sp. Ren11W TaxID=3413045 RepID=UPI003BF3B0A6